MHGAARRTWSLPTTAMLFSAWQAITQALHPMQAVLVDGHAPGIALVLPFRIDREFARRILRAFVRRFGIFSEIREVGLMNDVAAVGSLQQVKVLRGSEFVTAAGLHRIQTDVLPKRFRGAKSVWVEAHAGAGTSGVRASVTEVKRGRAVHVAGLYEYRRASERPS